MFYFGKSTFDALGNSYSSQSIVYLTNVPKYKLIDFDRFSKTAITIHFKYLFYILPPVILLVLSFKSFRLCTSVLYSCEVGRH